MMFTVLLLLLCILPILNHVLHTFFLSPLRSIPGPSIFRLTKWRLALSSFNGTRTRTIHAFHQKYGSAVRIAPHEIHFNSLNALRTIYGPGSPFGRTDFYRMFDVYGRQNLFTFHSGKEHAERKKLLAHAYSKSRILRDDWVRGLVSRKVRDYMRWIELRVNEAGGIDEIFTSLHYYSLDTITEFMYGKTARTEALQGNRKHQDLLADIVDPARRRLSGCIVHFPKVTKWLYTRTGFMEALVKPILPMQKPTTYTAIRAHALTAMERYKDSRKTTSEDKDTIIAKLYKAIDDGQAKLCDLEIASEVADHFLAGIDTTSDTLMFLIWALSLPGNELYQQKLVNEARRIPDSDLDEYGSPTIEATDRLPYLDAVIKETLRLYAPLPSSEPRSSLAGTIVDGYKVPAGTVVCMSPYSLHRNQDVFPEPLKWNPDRWLGNSPHVTEMKKWWWAFSSGARMCIGMHLALAEMALVPAIYRKYRTRVSRKSEGIAPGVTARVEVFTDDTFSQVQEHTCWIEFIEQ